MESSLITGTDSYKFSHFYQYPPNTTHVESHVAARRPYTAGFGLTVDQIVFFGLQAWIIDRLETPLNLDDWHIAHAFAKKHQVPFAGDAWREIISDHHGYLPIKIDALPEGTRVPVGVAQVRVTNTDPRFPWLTSYIETELLRAVWYPSTVASISAFARKILQDAADKSMDVPDVSFKLHDFGQRGASSRETAALGGMAHLLNFSGTDTTEGVLAARHYYNAYDPLAGFSIPAMEHSTVTAWGQTGEVDAFRNMIDQSLGPIVACVSDSYDYKYAVKEIWGNQLRDHVINSGKTVVIRPDSGDPTTMVLYALDSMSQAYGFTTNSKGFKVLNHIRVIQGDGINVDKMEDIVQAVLASGYSLENVAFGMGAGLLQKVDRDTFSYAMKANMAVIDGKIINVSKNPATDRHKRSWDGPIDVAEIDGVLTNVSSTEQSELHCVYNNGVVQNRQKFAEIKKRLYG